MVSLVRFFMLLSTSTPSFAGLARVDDPKTTEIAMQNGVFAGFENPKSEKVQCPEKSEVASITVAFSYPRNSQIHLPGVARDAKVLQNLGRNFAMESTVLDDEAAGNKAQFLMNLKKAARGRKFINLNLAAHGKTINNQYYLILPGAESCLKAQSSVSYRGLARVDEGPAEAAPNPPQAKSAVGSAYEPVMCADYMVSTKELRRVLGSKYLFGINLTCDSGSSLKMARSSMIAGTSASGSVGDQVSDIPGAGSGSEIAAQIADLTGEQKNCPQGMKNPNQVSFGDFGKVLNRNFVGDPHAAGLERNELDCFVAARVSPGCGGGGAVTAEKTSGSAEGSR